jgi:hypothetical protein
VLAGERFVVGRCELLVDVAMWSPAITTQEIRRAQQRLSVPRDWRDVIVAEIAGGSGNFSLVAAYPSSRDPSVSLLTESNFVRNVSAVAVYRFLVSGATSEFRVSMPASFAAVHVQHRGQGCYFGGPLTAPDEGVTVHGVLPRGSGGGGQPVGGGAEAVPAPPLVGWRLAAGAAGAVVLVVTFVTL